MVGSVNGFVPISGAFFCVFDPVHGPKVKCQVPTGAVVTSRSGEEHVPRLIDFNLIKSYCIPKAPLCNRLVSFRFGDFSAIGYPVNIVGDYYERNSFTYNFVFIFPSFRNSEPYESAITRLAKLTRALEEQSRYLSNEDNIYEIDSVLEQMFQDLNNFSECQIPFDRTNKVNIKLFPILEAPPQLRSFDVPVPTVQLNRLIDESWDPTMERIIPYINGVNSVRLIADLARANYELTRQCIQHLIHYDCVVIIGIFQFSNTYSPSPEVTKIALDSKVFEELRAFVYHPAGHGSTGSQTGSAVNSAAHSAGAQGGTSATTDQSSLISTASSDFGGLAQLTQSQAFGLYTAFHNGVSVYQWYNDNRELLAKVDVRRFLTFGIIERLIFRVHAYPVYDSRSSRLTPDQISNEAIVTALEAAGISASSEAVGVVRSCFKGCMSFDELCTELHSPRGKISQLLKSLGEWTIISR